MVKKGKDKAASPAPSVPAASKEASKSKKNTSATASGTSAGPSKDAAKGKKGPLVPAAETTAGPALAPPRPTVKQLIGGASWTGKLPVNLLSEHCQKQHWEKPDYDTKRTPDGFSVFISLSAKDPKTQDLIKLEPFKIPASHKHLVTRDTALEAKHAAATYALFRVCSMQNKHMIMPPDYRDLWKEFQTLKTQDVKDGKGWMYSPDPFRTLKEREEEKLAAEKERKRRELALEQEKAKILPGAAGLLLRSSTPTSSSNTPHRTYIWTNAPKIDMGKRTRSKLESLIQASASWNPRGVKMPASQKQSIVRELSQLGFRRSHIEEAADICKDREETLEWLLIHVPEDDLPEWALPGSYIAGVNLAATDLRREGAIQRLAQSGYSVDLCARTLDENDGDEGRAATKLQYMLFASGSGHEYVSDILDQSTVESAEDIWADEITSLQSVFGTNFTQRTEYMVEVKLDIPPDRGQKATNFALQIRRGPNYPSELIIGVISGLPSYIRLSVIKKALGYVEESLAGEPLKIYFVVDWIQNNIADIIDKPGKLVEISSVACSASGATLASPLAKGAAKVQKNPRPIKWVADPQSRKEWLDRQADMAWKEMAKKRQQLPAWRVRDEIVASVLENNITIISGETGSGKSTQSVQFILDDLYDKSLGHCANIIVTQPRRISALGLADRVAEERCSQVGQEIGYVIRGENRRSERTKITFVTTGILLRRLQVSGGRIEDVVASIADVSHVVIDEVHERSLDTDFLLTILREVLRIRRDGLKLVLMSATLDARTFKDYFISEGLSVGQVEIEGRTYPVDDFYLDDVIHLTGFSTEDGPRGVQGDQIAKTIQRLGHGVNYHLLSDTVRAIDNRLTETKKSGGILIFLPGVAEINKTCAGLRTIASLHVLPLHASLETREQKRVFQKAPYGKRKVVVATNVAETSITIDDIVAVVDSGRVKETSFDPQNNMRKLEETWASRAACKQRKGRAGRVQAGECYKLYTRNLEQQMPERPDPEIRRVPLEQLCLSVRAMGLRDVSGFLARSPTPPEATAVEGAIKLLGRIGALDGDELTALGQQLAMIPADLRCSKLMVYGSIFDCLDDCVSISAILSTKSPFFAPQDKREEAREARMRFSSGDGDLLTDLNAFLQWDKMQQEHVPQRIIRGWCDDNFLSFLVLSDIAMTRTQYFAALAEIGIVEPGMVASESHARPQSASSTLLRALVASAFSPQIARIQLPDKKFASSMTGAVELDPEARMIKYFTQENGRAFIHPSSTLFDNQGFSGHAAFLSYFTLISTSKIFLRDLTPFNAYTLLLFSGSIELDTQGRGLVVDGWLRLRGWARIGVLISRLRGMMDDLIGKKVENPSLNLKDSEIIRIASKLILLDGLDA